MNFLTNKNKSACITLGINKILKQSLILMFLLCAYLINAQEQAYVTADNGLTIRENPDLNARKMGKLNYGEQIEVIQLTDVKLVIIDEGEKISGNWAKIKTPTTIGYVFNGYLSKEKISETIEIRHTGFELKLKDLEIIDVFRVFNFFEKDTITINLDLGESPEGKTLNIKNEDYKRISIFQRYENSVTILNEGPHCDLTEWQHYYSDWKPIPKLNTNKFETLTYTQKEREQFIDISIEELKKEVLKNCGEDWLNYINKVKTVKDYPAAVSTNRIYLKIMMTDFNDKITEKIIQFEIPMGC